MRKVYRNCIGIFIFVLTLFLYNNVVLADHSSCATQNCFKLRQVAYVCPNNQGDDMTSGATCIMSLMNGSSAGMTQIDSTTNVPLKYDSTHDTIIVLISYFDTNTVDRIAAYTATTEYDPEKLQLLVVYGLDTDFPYSTGLFGSKTNEWPAPTITYGYGVTGVYGGSASNSADIFEGLIKVNNAINLTGTKLLPDPASKPGPYPTYAAFKVKTTQNGETSFKGYEVDEANYGTWMEAARRDANNNSKSYFGIMEDLTFNLGDKVELQYPIEDIKVYADSTKSKEYYFGVPGTTYTTSSHVNFATGTPSYDLYLPANTTSIYIDTKVTDGSTAGGDVGTKVVSVGSGTFTISGTSTGESGTVSNYSITYHVPDNTLKNITSSKGIWNTKTSTTNGFSAYNYNYTVYLKPTDTSSVDITSVLNDVTGAIQTEKGSTVVTSKTTNSTGTVTDTLTNVENNTTYTIKSYGWDCDSAYTAVLGECEYKTYTLTLKVLDRSLKSITVTGSSSGNPVYGISDEDFGAAQAIADRTYTVYIPHSETSVTLSMVANNTDDTPNPADINKAINSDGITSVVIVTQAHEANLALDDYTMTYNVNIYRLSETATLNSLTSSEGTLTAGTSYTDSNDPNMTVIPYTLTVGSGVTTTKLTTTASSNKSYVKEIVSGQTLEENWTISTETPYEVTIYSESCKSDYEDIPGNVCKKTKLLVSASQLSNNVNIDTVTVAPSSSGTPYTVTPKENYEYSVTVPSSVSSVYLAVTAEDKVSPATVTYDSKRGNDGMVTLGSEGSNTSVVATITAQDTAIHRDYTITIHRASTENALGSFTVKDGTKDLISFSATTYEYNVDIEDDRTKVVYSAQAENPLATLNETGNRTITNADFDFTSGVKTETLTLTVKPESCSVTGDTCTSKEYKVYITKKKTINHLTKITVKKGSDSTIIKEFTITASDTNHSYTVGIPNTETGAIIEVTKADSTETVLFDTDTTDATSKTYNSLSAGNNNKSISVVSEYGTDYKTDYSVNLYKLSDDDTTLSFTSTKGTLVVDENDSTKYTLNINDTETSTDITSTADAKSYVSYDETNGYQNTKTETWTFTSSNPDTYTITVYPERCKSPYNNGTACTASDGVEYTITKNTVSTSSKPGKIKVVKNDDDTVVYGTLDFTGTTEPETSAYTIPIPYDANNVKIIVEKVGNQTVSGDGTIATNGPAGGYAAPVVITAEAGGSYTTTYNLTLYKPSNENTLTALTLTPSGSYTGTLDPAFTDGTTLTYTYKISELETSVGVSATSSTNSFINSLTTNTLSDNWSVSSTNNAYTIAVYPERCKAAYSSANPACTEANDAKVYTINLEQLSNSKTLSGVSVNGVPATLDSGDNKWKVKLPPSSTGATITCSATSPISCTGSSITTLTDGANNTTVSVTAADGTTGTADVEVYRVSDKIGLDTLTFSNGSLVETLADGTYAYTARFSTSKTDTTVVPTPKYNGSIDGAPLSDWTFTGAPSSVADYKFTVKSESCDSSYNTTDYADIYATCKTQEYTLSYVPVSASSTLGSISVKNTDTNDTNEYFVETSISGLTYTVYVPATVENVKVKVQPEISGTTVSNNGEQTFTNMSYGGASSVASFTVTPEDTTVSPNVYTITVYRLNDDAELSALSASPNGTIGTLSTGVYNYDLALSSESVTTTNINATTNHAEASMKVNSETSGTKHQITNKAWDLSSNNTFTIKVSSEQCSQQNAVITTCSENTYTITKKILSDSVVLEGLTVKNTAETSEYTLDPAFSTSKTDYKVDLASNITTAAIIIDPGTKGITIDTTSITSGGTAAKDTNNPNKINVSGLSTGDNTVTINLKAENGTTTGSYTVNLHVKNTSTALTLSANPGTIGGIGKNLTLTVPNGTTSSELTATLPSGAQVTMAGSPVTPDSDHKAVATWSNFTDGDSYTIVVTPEEGAAETYTVTVTVLPPDQSGDNSITSLTANPGTLSSSTCAGGSCTLTVPYGTTSSEITIQTATGSKVTMNGTAKNTNSGTDTWTGITNGATYTISVEAENGDPAEYTITAVVQDPTDEDKDASLKSITVTKTDSDPTVTYTVFEPVFVPSDNTNETYSYTVFVPYETTRVDLAAEATNTSLTPVFSSQSGIVLAVGDNQETISVTSADSSKTIVYNINIYRISNKPELEEFDIGAGDLSPSFTSDNGTYTSYISTQYPSTTVTWKLLYNKAYATSETNTSTSDTWNFNNGTNNTYTLHTYAESCKDKFKDVEGNTCVDKEYTITATFFSPKITSDTFGLTLSTATDGGVSIDIIADARLYSTGSDLKGVQTDNPETLLKLYEADETTEVADGSDLATGMVLKLLINSVEYDKRYIVIPGEVNGDADIDVTDILDVVDHILGNTTLDGVYFKAADVAEDDDIDVTDILEIVDLILG